MEPSQRGDTVRPKWLRAQPFICPGCLPSLNESGSNPRNYRAEAYLVSLGLARPPVTGARKLSAAHFAFMRGLVQGLPVHVMWERYLGVEGSSSDRRTVRATIAWMRDAFAAAARREDRFGTARLVLLDVGRIGKPSAPLPSLDEFAIAEGLEDFSQAEQMARYEAHFGKASQRQMRRERLVKKQLEALAWLESLVAQPPRAGDPVAAWFRPEVAALLEASNLFTLSQLVDHINGIGQRWAAPIRAVGSTKAERIVAWLRANEATIGVAVGKHVVRPRRAVSEQELHNVVQAATGLRPLEKLRVPAALDGSSGAFRAPQAQCLLPLANDCEAILAWIRSKNSLSPEQVTAARERRRSRHDGLAEPLDWMLYLSHTQRAYRKEAERFLLWAVLEHGKPLSSMTAQDCAAYWAFVADPQPRSRWCGRRYRERWSPLWRPFEGGLSPAAQRQAIAILKSLYGYWVDIGYVVANPWQGIDVPRSRRPRVNPQRSLTDAQWRFVLEQARRGPERCSKRRLRLALALLHATGLRLSEAVAARIEHLEWSEVTRGTDDHARPGCWLLNVG
ncbi:MAG: integrase, partial [Rhizobacter sp.]|nr:integrase [Rhizobacter sp.]